MPPKKFLHWSVNQEYTSFVLFFILIFFVLIRTSRLDCPFVLQHVKVVDRLRFQKLRLFTGDFHADLNRAKANNTTLAYSYGIITPKYYNYRHSIM